MSLGFYFQIYVNLAIESKLHSILYNVYQNLLVAIRVTNESNAILHFFQIDFDLLVLYL